MIHKRQGTGIRRRFVWGGLALVALTIALVALLGATTATQADVATQASVAAVPSGRVAYEFVGRINQDGLNFVGMGYVTYASGVGGDVLFTDPVNHQENTARITFYSTSTLTARSVISNVFVLDSTGTTTFYYNAAAGANFENPASFQNGTVIGTVSGRYQDILTVTGPNAGLAVTNGELVQQTAGQFSYYGQTYTWGEPGMAQHLWYTGPATRTEPAIPRSFVIGAGQVTATGYNLSLPTLKKGTSSVAPWRSIALRALAKRMGN